MREFVKSILLVVLTISALIMAEFIFVNDKDVVEASEISYQPSELIEYIRPQNYIFSFGDLFIQVYDDEYKYVEVREHYEAAFNAFLTSKEKFDIAEITVSNFQEQLKRRSLRVNYPFDYKLKDLLSMYDFNTQLETGLEDIHVTSILFLLNRTDTIYIYDGKLDQYYRLTGAESELWITDMFESVDRVKSNDDAYITLEGKYNFLKTGLSKYNIEEENLLLTPIASNIEYPIFGTVPEIGLGESASEQQDNFAEHVFGNDLNFVKKSVYSDGSTIFMYGYGDKVFKINSDGSLEYTEKSNNNTAKQSLDFKIGLGKSIDQISRIGVPGESLYLSGYEQIENSNSFETVYLFNYTKNGIPYHTDSRTGDAIEVRFYNDQLVQVYKNSRIVLFEALDRPQTTKNFINILEKNRIAFEFDFKEDHPDMEIDENDIFQMALQNMKVLDVKYYLKDEELTPVWYIIIADRHYIIDLTDGWIIDYSE